jgi:hypothetical protein
MPRGGDRGLEPGSAPGTLRFSLVTLYGSDFEGGHFSRDGAAPDGGAVTVPLYRHEVSLDFMRLELGLQYTLSEEWDLVARIPWEQKRQNAGIGFIEPATPAEREAMQRDIDIHHRSITLRGIGDLMFLGRRRTSNLWREGDALAVSAGVTAPTGRTVENPYRLGDEGLQHLHIQFGTGTVDPLLEASYSMPLAGPFATGAYFAGRAPLYENSRGFHAPPDGTLGAHVAYNRSDRWQLRVEGALYAQGYGSWDGERDENTGLVATSVTGGATVRLRGVSVSADVRFPISQRTLIEGDAFTQGPMFIVSAAWSSRAQSRDLAERVAP